ncbi:hypothetical protein TWF225_003288 [Orbilia oligospora]|nr:hypothetical protein TWF225_003288 [Orbilia oligospora]KAF3238037.1 hypothetical protein TWF128_000710 [Orbilia oligospora]KAF3267312.1 hypothetical protein TWF217_000383 [Orbilia oligospora]KAF3294329.1 hypothetical protein TWF132_003325 [Orbilia oligospora]
MDQPHGTNPGQGMDPLHRVPMLYISPPVTDSIPEVEAASVPHTRCPVYNLFETRATDIFPLGPMVSQQSSSDENTPACTGFQNENSQMDQPSSIDDGSQLVSISQDPTSDIARS